MSVLETPSDRLLLLIEQFKLNLKSKDSIENTIKKTAVLNAEFGFLQEISERGKTMPLDENLSQQLQKENSSSIKSFLNALNSKELAAQKLEELRIKILNDRKAELDRLLSVSTKIGWIAAIILIPVVISFASSLSEVFAVADIEFTVSDSTTILAIIGCAALISYILFSKRRQNG